MNSLIRYNNNINEFELYINHVFLYSAKEYINVKRFELYILSPCLGISGYAYGK